MKKNILPLIFLAQLCCAGDTQTAIRSLTRNDHQPALTTHDELRQTADRELRRHDLLQKVHGTCSTNTYCLSLCFPTQQGCTEARELYPEGGPWDRSFPLCSGESHHKHYIQCLRNGIRPSQCMCWGGGCVLTSAALLIANIQLGWLMLETGVVSATLPTFCKPRSINDPSDPLLWPPISGEIPTSAIEMNENTENREAVE